MEIKIQRGRGSTRAPTLPDPGTAPEQPPGTGPAPDQPSDADTSNPALAQIRTRDYSARYRGLPSRGLFELGLVFDAEARNLVRADWRPVA